MKFAFILLLIFSERLFAEFSFDFKVSGIDSNRLIQFERDVLERLPPKIKEDLNKRVTVHFKPLEEKIAGQVRFNKIYLNTRWIEVINSTETLETKRKHQTKYREAVATLLHEVTHLWDQGNFHLTTEQDLIDECHRYGENGINSHPSCAPYNNMRHSLSENPRFLYLSGWKKNPLSKNSSTGFLHQSPDEYEAKNPEEFLAVNMEYFLLDENYECRRPLLFELFKNRLNFSPFQTRCTQSEKYLSFDQESAKISLKDIDINRLYEIHYFLAGPGDAMMSRWGHAMIRFVMCAPKTPMGPKCLEDLSHHLILSYRALVNTPQISSIGGLTGKYPSRLFFLKLSEVIDEYNKGELRDLLSIPLKLTPSEKKRFFQRALEVHWTYDGKYFFVSNNCATETANLIRAGIENSKISEERISTPTGLRDTLLELNLIDLTPLKNRSEAITKGYIFDSYRGRFLVAFNKIKQNLPPSINGFEKYLTLTPNERMIIFEKSLNDLSRAEIASFLLLENGAFRKARVALLEEVAKYILDNNNQTDEVLELKERAEKMTETGSLVTSPWEIIREQKSYGIPLPNELEIIRDQINTALPGITAMSQQEMTDKIEKIVGSDQLIALKGSLENIKRMGRSFKSTK